MQSVASDGGAHGLPLYRATTAVSSDRGQAVRSAVVRSDGERASRDRRYDPAAWDAQSAVARPRRSRSVGDRERDQFRRHWYDGAVTATVLTPPGQPLMP